MLEKLFEAMDEKVFTPELKESLEAQFNEAVELKASVIAEEKIEEVTKDLNEKAEAEKTEFETNMVESLDKYLERVVEEFMVEARESLEESEKSEKADMIIEAMEAMLVATGVEVSRISEAKTTTDVETKLTESVEKQDKLVEEVMALKEENEKLLKAGIIMEMSEGLSLIEAEKFKKVAELVEFSKDKKYAEKLETLKESISKKETEEKIEESVKTKEDNVPSWKHLV